MDAFIFCCDDPDEPCCGAADATNEQAAGSTVTDPPSGSAAGSLFGVGRINYGPTNDPSLGRVPPWASPYPGPFISPSPPRPEPDMDAEEKALRAQLAALEARKKRQEREATKANLRKRIAELEAEVDAYDAARKG